MERCSRKLGATSEYLSGGQTVGDLVSTCQASSDHTIGLRDCLGRGLGLITPACPSSGMFFHSGAGPSGRRVCKRSEVGGGGGWGVCRKEKLTLSRTRPPTLVLALGTLGRTHVRKTLHCACPPPRRRHGLHLPTSERRIGRRGTLRTAPILAIRGRHLLHPDCCGAPPHTHRHASFHVRSFELDQSALARPGRRASPTP